MPDVEQTGDEGFSLIELVVAMALFAGIMAVVYGCLLTVLKDTRDVTNRADAVEQSKRAVAQIERQVRSGNVLMAPTADEMRIFTQSNGLERCVQWRVDGTGALRTRSWSPTWQTDGLVSSYRTVATGIRNTLTGSSAEPPFSLQGGTTAFNSRLMTVRLFTRTAATGKRVEITTSVSGRNTNYGYDGSVCLPVPAG